MPGAVLAVLILAAVALLAARLDPEPGQLSGQARISDGDSFHLGEERIRLLGIDAPELAQTCKTRRGGDWPCGRVARDRLSALIRSGTLACDAEGRDKYRRILATCRVDGRDIAKAMVADGLAVSSDSYWLEQQTAKAKRLGLWQGDFQQPRAWRDRQVDQKSDPWSWLMGFMS